MLPDRLLAVPEMQFGTSEVSRAGLTEAPALVASFSLGIQTQEALLGDVHSIVKKTGDWENGLSQTFPESYWPPPAAAGRTTALR